MDLVNFKWSSTIVNRSLHIQFKIRKIVPHTKCIDIHIDTEQSSVLLTLIILKIERSLDMLALFRMNEDNNMIRSLSAQFML